MNRCILFFMVLVFTLALAVITDDDRSLFKEDTLVKYNRGNQVDIAEHKTLPAPDYLLEGE